MKAEYIDHMGSDLSIVNAARVSFGKSKEKMEESDEKLIKYLAKHNHWTPFAHTAITLRMSAPVPVRTQMFKHKAGFVENEESRRYISTMPELFVPDTFRAKPEGSIKQGSAGIHANSDQWKKNYLDCCNYAIGIYMDMLDDGVCPEQARFSLPQGVKVNWVWTGSLAAFARVYNQRIVPDAQHETHVLAREIGDIIQPLFPIGWGALTA